MQRSLKISEDENKAIREFLNAPLNFLIPEHVTRIHTQPLSVTTYIQIVSMGDDEQV